MLIVPSVRQVVKRVAMDRDGLGEGTKSAASANEALRRWQRRGGRSMAFSRLRIGLAILAATACAYGLIAYVALPSAWSHHEHQKRLEGLSMVTQTNQGIPGDPLNVGLVGTEDDVVCAMHAAGWYPADPITLRSSLRLIGSVLLARPYPDAPVSALSYQGRREDLAFEKPDGRRGDRRHHVRFWEVLNQGEEGRAVWLGSATFDRSVGLSHYTGQVTHHIASNIDAEREQLADDLGNARVVETVYEISGIGPTLNAHNGGGDVYSTDGEIKISRLVEACTQRVDAVAKLENPPLIKARNIVWRNLMKFLGGGRSDHADD
jgi:hypothetical protein